MSEQNLSENSTETSSVISSELAYMSHYFPVKLDDKIVVAVNHDELRAISIFYDYGIAQEFAQKHNQREVGFEGWTPHFFTKPFPAIPFHSDAVE